MKIIGAMATVLRALGDLIIKALPALLNQIRKHKTVKPIGVDEDLKKATDDAVKCSLSKCPRYKKEGCEYYGDETT